MQTNNYRKIYILWCINAKVGRYVKKYVKSFQPAIVSSTIPDGRYRRTCTDFMISGAIMHGLIFKFTTHIWKTTNYFTMEEDITFKKRKKEKRKEQKSCWSF